MSAERSTMDFGTRLREARERKGVSLRTIAEATKISVAVLEALERNDVSRLPGGIFSRAFVRSYALEVGLDPEATIQEFVAQFPHDSVTAGHQTSAAIEAASLESDRRTAKTFIQLVGVGVPILGALLYFGLGMRRAARVPDPLPAVDAPAPPPEAAAPAVTRAPTPPAAAAPTPTAAPPVVPEAAAKTDPPSDEGLTIGLLAKRRCYVSATVDGRKAIEQLLPEGDHRTLDVKREMVLTAGDAAAIVMTLNGAPARPLGKNGEVVTVRVNPANFKDYLSTR
jgi:transcriptional regulator with XRE-family HTH domain